MNDSTKSHPTLSILPFFTLYIQTYIKNEKVSTNNNLKVHGNFISQINVLQSLKYTDQYIQLNLMALNKWSSGERGNYPYFQKHRLEKLKKV